MISPGLATRQWTSNEVSHGVLSPLAGFLGRMESVASSRIDVANETITLEKIITANKALMQHDRDTSERRNAGQVLDVQNRSWCSPQNALSVPPEPDAA